MRRRRLGLVIAVCAALVLIGTAIGMFVIPWPDSNHTSAVQVVQNAGVGSSGAPATKQ